MAETDGNKRPLSFLEDEEIEIKPSTELIPDVYERKNNENILVHLVCRQTDEVSDDLAEHLTSLGFSVHKTLIDRIINIMDESWIKNFVAGVNNTLNTERCYDGLLMIFAKVSFRSDMLKAIWGSFTSNECPALKNKPKLFIFQVYKRGPSSDAPQVDLTKAYDTPAEADILLVFDKITSESSSDFLENFHQHIKDYAQQEDIISLVSLCIGSESRPVVISTMTKKFFFTLQQYRGHHHNISEYHTEIKENLEKINKYVKNMPDHKPKETERSFVNIVKRKFSFKKNHAKESDNRENNKARGSETGQKLSDVKEEKRVSEAPEPSEVKRDNAVRNSIKKAKHKPLKPPKEIAAVPPKTSPTRKTSIPQPITPTRRISRPRLPSGNFSSKEDLVPKKKPWL